MSGNVSFDEIETVRRHVYDALLGSSARSTLPEQKQDELLAQACAEACDILDQWVSSPVWEGLRPAAGDRLLMSFRTGSASSRSWNRLARR